MFEKQCRRLVPSATAEVFRLCGAVCGAEERAKGLTTTTPAQIALIRAESRMPFVVCLLLAHGEATEASLGGGWPADGIKIGTVGREC